MAKILIYAGLVAPIGFAPYLVGLAGPFYAALSLVLGAAFVFLAFRVWKAGQRDPNNAAAKRLFGFSILYLFLLFAALLFEHLVAAMDLI